MSTPVFHKNWNLPIPSVAFYFFFGCWLPYCTNHVDNNDQTLTLPDSPFWIFCRTCDPRWSRCAKCSAWNSWGLVLFVWKIYRRIYSIDRQGSKSKLVNDASRFPPLNFLDASKKNNGKTMHVTGFNEAPTVKLIQCKYLMTNQTDGLINSGVP